MHKSLFFIAAFAALVAVPKAQAIEPLTATELKEYCDGHTDESNEPLHIKCRAYIRGFLDGAVATDERVAENIVAEFEKDESFTERAIRTRLSRAMREISPTYYAEFCVGTPVPKSAVVARVIDELENRDDLTDRTAMSIVYAALKRHYPCAPAPG